MTRLRQLLIQLLIVAGLVVGNSSVYATGVLTPAASVAGGSGGGASAGEATDINGLLLGNGSVLAAYAGTTCTNQLVRVLSAAGAATCVTITSAYVDSSIQLALSGLTGNLTIFDGSQASRTITMGVTGTDPVMTVSASTINVSTGAFQVGGVAVLTGITASQVLTALAAATGNVTLWDGSNATQTLTAAVSGIDPVITFSNGLINITTGALQVAGSSVLTAVVESNLSFTDVTTGNASTTKHGLLVKLPNDATKYMDGTGVWSVPAGSADLSGANVLCSNDCSSLFPNMTNVGTPLSPTDDCVGVGDGSAFACKVLANGITKYTTSTNTFSAATEADIPFSDITTGNASTSNHGFLKKLDNNNSNCMSGQGNWVACSGGSGTVVWEEPQGLRLSLTSNTYITTSDVTGATTLYYTPVVSGGYGVVTCYNGSALEKQAIQQKSLATPSLTAAKPYDIFYDCVNGDVEALVWTNGTTRATALADQNGAIVKTGDLTKLYLGTIYSSGTDTMEDSAAKRLVCNAYNKVDRQLVAVDTANTWSAPGATTWRQANSNTANKVETIACLAGQTTIDLTLIVMHAGGGTDDGALAIGVDSVTSPSCGPGVLPCMFLGNTTTLLVSNLRYTAPVALGYHYFSWMEYTGTAITTRTFYGDNGGGVGAQSGLIGKVRQ